MKNWLLILGVGFFLPAPAWGQIDSCAGAYDALLRVKERIAPDLPATTLKTLLSTLQSANRACPLDLPEVWYYRLILAQQLKDVKEVNYVKNSLASLNQTNYRPSYGNPFQPVAPAAPPKPILAERLGRKWALVVGINDFADNRIKPLSFAAKDATDFAAYLKDDSGGKFNPDRVRLLTNQEATLENFRVNFGWLRDNVKPEDLVVVFLSSHGSPRDSDPNGVSYVLMHDSKIDNSAKIYATSVQMIDLVQQINRELKARRVVLFLDTCFSGDAAANADSGSKRGIPMDAPSSLAFSESLQRLNMGTGRAVVTASRANEVSYEDDSVHNGFFTHVLIEALRGAGEKGLGDIFPSIRQSVLDGVGKAHPGHTQTPSYEFTEKAGSIRISAPEGALVQ